MALSRIALPTLILAAIGCYKPNILNGGLGCSDAGTCPEGFVCSPIDDHCYTPDGGPSCPANKPHVAQLCSDGPASGSVCNPACQTGCPCGRCALVGNVATCVEVGTKNEGNVCNVTADDCGVGLGCVKEPCGTDLGRCRKFCQGNADCSGTVQCTTHLGPALICDDVPTQTCNPVDGTNCPTGLFCYVRVLSTICECPGTLPVGAMCGSDTDCTPGERCLSEGNGQPAVCFQVCATTGANICTAPAVNCRPIGGGFGYCTQM